MRFLCRNKLGNSFRFGWVYVDNTAIDAILILLKGSRHERKLEWYVPDAIKVIHDINS